MPLVARTAKQDAVRELQRKRYRAAKADPGRRFHALYDEVYRRDVLERAWEPVRANRGAAGIDRQTIADVEQYGIEPAARRAGRGSEGRALASVAGPRMFIPKPGSRWSAAAVDPRVRDRVVQAASKTVIEPIFEADMLECSLGFVQAIAARRAPGPH